MPEALKPEHSKVVLTDGKEFTSRVEVILALIEPGRPDAWKQGAMGEHLRKLIRKGDKVVVVIGNRKRAFNISPPASFAEGKRPPDS